MNYYNILTILSAILIFTAFPLAILYLRDIVGGIFQPRRTPNKFPVKFWKEK